MHHPIDRITHTTAFATPVVEHWLEHEMLLYDTRKLLLKDTGKLLSYGRKGGNVLFNDALNTFYLRLYDIGHMATVKDNSDSERGNLLPPHGLTLSD